MSNMYLHNYFCTLVVLDEKVFLETNLYKFLLNIAYRTSRTIGTNVRRTVRTDYKCISNIY